MAGTSPAMTMHFFRNAAYPIALSSPGNAYAHCVMLPAPSSTT